MEHIRRTAVWHGMRGTDHFNGTSKRCRHGLGMWSQGKKAKQICGRPASLEKIKPDLVKGLIAGKERGWTNMNYHVEDERVCWRLRGAVERKSTYRSGALLRR